MSYSGFLPRRISFCTGGGRRPMLSSVSGFGQGNLHAVVHRIERGRHFVRTVRLPERAEEEERPSAAGQLLEPLALRMPVQRVSVYCWSMAERLGLPSARQGFREAAARGRANWR